jgi:hypothetical protein
MRYRHHARYVCSAAQSNQRNTIVVVLCNETCALPRTGFVKQGLTPFTVKTLLPARHATRDPKNKNSKLKIF